MRRGAIFNRYRTRTTRTFLERLHERRYGPDARVATDPMAAAYAGMYLWARAVNASGSDHVADIREAMLSQSFEAPEGELMLDSENRHAWRGAIIGQVGKDLQYDIVWSSAPGHRSRALPQVANARGMAEVSRRLVPALGWSLASKHPHEPTDDAGFRTQSAFRRIARGARHD